MSGGFVWPHGAGRMRRCAEPMVASDLRRKGDERVITSKALTGNPLGDPAERPLLVYVPPGYDNGNRRYPSVYVIQGYTGQAVMWGNRNPFRKSYPQAVDQLFAVGTMPAIVVF